MTKIIVDATTLARLRSIRETVQLCDESGLPLGNFTPVLASNREPQISEEELTRRLQQGGGRPLADILADLERRG